jgi:DNA-binding NarL/FixJ family response regulator
MDIKLTSREEEVLTLAAIGCSVSKTAKLLEISPSTVKAHRGSALMALLAEDTTHAIGEAFRLGLLTREKLDKAIEKYNK